MQGRGGQGKAGAEKSRGWHGRGWQCRVAGGSKLGTNPGQKTKQGSGLLGNPTMRNVFATYWMVAVPLQAPLGEASKRTWTEVNQAWAIHSIFRFIRKAVSFHMKAIEMQRKELKFAGTWTTRMSCTLGCMRRCSTPRTSLA